MTEVGATFECQITSLISGYNATGYSTMISVVKCQHSSVAESDNNLEADENVAVLNRILINVGDGTQRFCSENRIKLSSLSMIVISSLSPHNLAGFPGIFLSLSDLGVAALDVVGPPGIKACIDLMLPFINRKYPALHVREIDHAPPSDGDAAETAAGGAGHTVLTRCLTLHFHPITASANPSTVIAIATCVVAHSAAEVAAVHSLSPLTVTVLPVAGYFSTEPSLAALQSWSRSTTAAAAEGSRPRNVLLFAPLAAASTVRPVDAEQLAALCASCDALGLLTTGQLAAEVASIQASSSPPSAESSGSGIWSDGDNLTEFRHCRNTLSILHGIFPPLFPKPAAGQAEADTEMRLATIRDADLTWMEGPGQAEKERLRLFSVRPRVAVCFPLSGSRAFVRTALLSEKIRSIDPQSILPVISKLRESHEAKEAAAEEDGAVAKKSRSLEPPEPPPPEDGPVATKLLKLSLQALVLSEEDGGSGLSAPDSADSSAAGNPSPDPLQKASWLRDANSLKRKLLRYEDNCDRDPYPDLDAAAGIPRFSPEHSPRMPPAPPGRLAFPFDDQQLEEDDDGPSPRPSPAPSPFLPPATQRLLSPSGIHPPPPPPPNPVSDIFQLTFLGTGSATPSKYRNSSCVLLTLSQKRSAPGPGPLSDQHIQVLLDVGEGSSSQLFQHCGGDEVRFDELLLGISLIWISHHHADHCCGLPMLLENIQRARIRSSQRRRLLQSEQDQEAAPTPTQTLTSSASCEEEDFSAELQASRANRVASAKIRRQLQKQQHGQQQRWKQGHGSDGGRQQFEEGKVLLIASDNVLAFAEYMASIAGLEDLLCPYPIASTLYAGNRVDVSAASQGAVARIQSVPVYHCQHSYGCVLEFSSGHKVVYSGDCRPSQSLVKAGLHCDLLIHEATFHDDKADDALKKKHCTVFEAASIAQQMRARHIVLTHFSQRYPTTVMAAAAAAAEGQGGPGRQRTKTAASGWSTEQEEQQQQIGQGDRGTGPGPEPGPEDQSGEKSSGRRPKSFPFSSAQNSSVSSPVRESAEALAAAFRAVQHKLSYACDFLHFSFPSQVSYMPASTQLLADIMKTLDEQILRS